MTDTSVEAQAPPAQDARPVIASWRTEGYHIRLDATENGATIVCTSADGVQEFGEIDYTPQQNRHVIAWNRTGCLALEQYKRDYWDTAFYAAMAAWRRKQGEDELASWRQHQEREFQERLRAHREDYL